MGIPATGNYLNLSGTTIVTMRDGRIAKEQDFFNMKSLLDQLQNSEGEVTVDEYQKKPPLKNSGLKKIIWLMVALNCKMQIQYNKIK